MDVCESGAEGARGVGRKGRKFAFGPVHDD